jgi:hypothetical protein
VLRAGVRATVQVDPEIADLLGPEPIGQPVEDHLQLVLSVGDRVVAEAVAGAGHRPGVRPASVHGQTQLGQPCGQPVHLRRRHVADDEVLLPGEA